MYIGIGIIDRTCFENHAANELNANKNDIFSSVQIFHTKYIRLYNKYGELDERRYKKIDDVCQVRLIDALSRR